MCGFNFRSIIEWKTGSSVNNGGNIVMSDAGSTNFTPAICTQCGAALEVDPRLEAAVCKFCKTPFIVEKAIQNYNVQHMAVKHVDSINIVKTNTIDSLLKFADKQITKRAEDKKRIEEEERLKREKNSAFIKKYWWVYIAVMGVMFLALNFIGAKDSKNSDGKIAVGISSDEVVGKNYEEVVLTLKQAGFTNVETMAINDLVTGWLTKNGEVEKVEIDRYTTFRADSKYDASTRIVVHYHTFKGQTSLTTKQVQTTENPSISTSDNKSASSVSSASTKPSNTSALSVYDYAYIKPGKEYSNYYLIDTDKKTVKSFSTDDSGFTGTYTGDLKNGIDILYSVDKIREQIKFAKANDDSSIIVTDPNGFKWTFTKTSIAEAEKILNKNG
jgi:hypothetical protein